MAIVVPKGLRSACGVFMPCRRIYQRSVRRAIFRPYPNSPGCLPRATWIPGSEGPGDIWYDMMIWILQCEKWCNTIMACLGWFYCVCCSIWYNLIIDGLGAWKQIGTGICWWFLSLISIVIFNIYIYIFLFLMYLWSLDLHSNWQL